MDQIYFWIIILFIIILFLDYCEKNIKKKSKETFTNQEPISNLTTPPYFQENKLYISAPTSTLSAVNLNNKNLNFKNFTTDAVTPPFLKCPSCNLYYGCTDFPYDVDDQYQNVCHKCENKLCNNSKNMPVYAKAVGKPRVCRNLK
jgi:hypothetical protein